MWFSYEESNWEPAKAAHVTYGEQIELGVSHEIDSFHCVTEGAKIAALCSNIMSKITLYEPFYVVDLSIESLAETMNFHLDFAVLLNPNFHSVYLYACFLFIYASYRYRTEECISK